MNAYMLTLRNQKMTALKCIIYEYSVMMGEVSVVSEEGDTALKFLPNSCWLCCLHVHLRRLSNKKKFQNTLISLPKELKAQIILIQADVHVKVWMKSIVTLFSRLLETLHFVIHCSRREVSLKFLHGESRVTISGQEYSVISE
jgi:hypothetical protein